jgi:hypothetical protein
MLLTMHADTSPVSMIRRMHQFPAALALMIAASLPATPAQAESESAFAYRLCGLFHSPVGFPPATGNPSFGAGSGCTWKIGNGDVGTTATEMRMMAWRDAGPGGIAKAVNDYDDMYEKLSIIPGHRTKDIAIACDTSGAPARMVFWGIPSKSNITGYAVCGTVLVYGEIHSPPDSDMDTESVFVEMMKTTAGAISCCAASQHQVSPKSQNRGGTKPVRRRSHS